MQIDKVTCTAFSRIYKMEEISSLFASKKSIIAKKYNWASEHIQSVYIDFIKSYLTTLRSCNLTVFCTTHLCECLICDID